jgi:tRNA (mo5U34)-methyltransferase
MLGSLPLFRFSPLVRKGLAFRKEFERAKRAVPPVAFDWYRYDSFPNLFYVQHLLKNFGSSLEELAGQAPVLDLGAADGALSFFLERLGHRVHAIDYAGCNMNRMQGIRTLARYFESHIEIHDFDLDSRFELPGQYGVAFFLGTLYHLKNPFFALEKTSAHARFCFLSTRVARLAADRRTHLGRLPVAYLVDPTECNGDSTNYFIFSPAGLLRLVERAGWCVRGAANSGDPASDPVSAEHDERMFLLLESTRRALQLGTEPADP